MQTILTLTIPLRKTNGEFIPRSYLTIEADKHGQAVITLTRDGKTAKSVYINTDDLKETATTLWLFLKK